LSVLQFDTGPRIGVGEIGEIPVSVRPFFSTDYLAYGAYTYAVLYGGGLSSQIRPSSDLTVDLTGPGRFGNYQNSSFRPLTRQYTGPESSVILSASYALTPAVTAQAQIFYYGADARFNYFSRSGPGGSVSVAAEMAAAGYPLAIVGRLGLRQLKYGGPDPFLNPLKTRNDTIFEAGLSLIVPIYDRLKGVVQYAFYQQYSTYQLYSYNDHAVSFGLRFDF
jgi:hypothetical protein